MDKNLYREKNVKQLQSPEELNDYIKVTNAGVWMVLTTIIVLLIGVCVWGYFGKLETKIDVLCVAKDNTSTLYVKEESYSKIKEDQSVYINKETYKIKSIANEPISVTDSFSDYALHLGNLTIGEWVYEVKIDSSLTEGNYKAEIVVDSVSPFYFIFN